MSRKKEKIRIIKKDYDKEDYTFVGSSDNILNTNKNNESIIDEIKSGAKLDERFEKKIHSKKSQHKGRKILGKSLQGHSPTYE